MVCRGPDVDVIRGMTTCEMERVIDMVNMSSQVGGGVGLGNW